jgi:murein DD-endopeptidase MepM/ murein hydrolase activator NlpD
MIKRYLIISILLLAVAVLAGWFFFIRDSEAPVITLFPDKDAVSKQTSLTVWGEDKGTGISRLEVWAVKSTKKYIVFRKEYPLKPELVTEKFNLKKVPITDGNFSFEILAVDGTTKNSTQLRKDITLDSKPPKIAVKSRPPYVRRGGSSCVVYAVDEDVVSTGVMVGDLFFKGFKQENGEYFSFFAFPYYMSLDEFSPVLMATDRVGNLRQNTLAVKNLRRKFRNKTSKLNDAFFKKIVNEFRDKYPGIEDPLELFLKINSELRSKNRKTLLKIGRETSPRMLWEGTFLRQPRSATFSEFGDHRRYMVEGKIVDEQDHLGMDLASLRHAEVLSSNSGEVVYAGDLGIYGLTVIIDHGLGLQSMYAHLSEIAVDKGQPVEKAEIIGRTGTTGLAFGDHLHFAMVMAGLAVTPVEWWDKSWIQDNITGRMAE